MKTFRFVFPLILTLAIAITLNSRLVVGGTAIQPLGKFLSPFHGFLQNAENKPIDLAKSINSDEINELVNIHFDELYFEYKGEY